MMHTDNQISSVAPFFTIQPLKSGYITKTFITQTT